MSNKPVTVSDVSHLIAAHSQARAELQLLALEAYEQWQDIESRIAELEGRLATACDALSEVRLRVSRPVEGEERAEPTSTGE